MPNEVYELLRYSASSKFNVYLLKRERERERERERFAVLTLIYEILQ